jgi:hypothetical protein
MASTVAIIPCSDDFRHPDGTAVKMRRLPDLFFPAECLETWGGPVVGVGAGGGEGGASFGARAAFASANIPAAEGAAAAPLRWARVRAPPVAPPYPSSSPFRCHQCLLRFSGAPMFIPLSVQTRPGTQQLLVTAGGHYCCQACRVRALEDLPESCRLAVVRVDLACLGRVLDMSEAAPPPWELEPFGGPVPLGALLALRARTGFAPEDLEMLAASVPARVRFGYRVRFVRETYYGTLEGGCGEQEALRRLLLHAPPERRLLREAAAEAVPGEEGEEAPQGPAPGTQLGDEGAECAGWRRAGVSWGMRFVDASPPPAAAARWLCPWCAGAAETPRLPVRVPEARDPGGTVTLRGAFCSTGCALAHLMAASRHGVSPAAYAERLGIMAWLAVHRHGVPFGARLACAPHRLELAEFGGDLARGEFDAQKVLPDLHTSLEAPPFCSARMAPNYTRPGVVCDLSRVGESGRGGEAPAPRFEMADQRRGKTQGLFEALAGSTEAAKQAAEA